MIAILLVALALIMPPCATEDSVNCHWDASASGNGVGSSFIDVNGTAYYLP